MGTTELEDQGVGTDPELQATLDAFAAAMPLIIKTIEDDIEKKRKLQLKIRQAICKMPRSVFKFYRSRKFDTEVCEAIKLAMQAKEPKTHSVHITIPFVATEPPAIVVNFSPTLT